MKTIEDYRRLSKTIEDYQRLLKTIKDYRRLSKTNKDYWRLLKTIEDYQRPFWVVFKHCELSCILNVLEKRKKSAAMQDRRCILNTETTQYYKKWPIMEYVRVKYGCEICLSIHYYRVSQKVWNMFIKKFWVRRKLRFFAKMCFYK